MSTKRKVLDAFQDSSSVPAVSHKLSRHSSVVTDGQLDDDDASSSHCEDTSKLVMIRRYCLIFADDADDSLFESDSPVVARVEAVVARVVAAAADNGQQLVAHKYTQGVEPYALNAQDGELWCSIPESALDEIASEFGPALEAIVEEYAF